MCSHEHSRPSFYDRMRNSVFFRHVTCCIHFHIACCTAPKNHDVMHERVTGNCNRVVALLKNRCCMEGSSTARRAPCIDNDMNNITGKNDINGMNDKVGMDGRNGTNEYRLREWPHHSANFFASQSIVCGHFANIHQRMSCTRRGVKTEHLTRRSKHAYFLVARREAQLSKLFHISRFIQCTCIGSRLDDSSQHVSRVFKALRLLNIRSSIVLLFLTDWRRWFGRVTEQSPLTGCEPNNLIEISREHTPINFPSGRNSFSTDFHDVPTITAAFDATDTLDAEMTSPLFTQGREVNPFSGSVHQQAAAATRNSQQHLVSCMNRVAGNYNFVFMIMSWRVAGKCNVVLMMKGVAGAERLLRC